MAKVKTTEIFNKEYPGYESLYDVHRDVSELCTEFEEQHPEFTGTIKVVITYEEDK